ncbi:uncharacterized protein LOC108719254 [Xenopus laevis]|uniref:Uncharacterized protein n=2 Tax=Xenopus laevis TaxID=8355 RepID=A0A974CPX7_XENLA|nr:uncharacterized protein LOC108719254 [Xenopus laevis]OCT76812.1 hypothetical protein XELAEV_18032015mg [Xenopus laevis]
MAQRRRNEEDFDEEDFDVEELEEEGDYTSSSEEFYEAPPQRSWNGSHRDQERDEAAQQPQENGEADDGAPEAQGHAAAPAAPAAAIRGQPQEEGRQLGERPAVRLGVVNSVMTAMQPIFRRQRRQALCMRRWMAQMHFEMCEIRFDIHRGFQDLLAAQPHQPEGSAEGQVPGPSAVASPHAEAPQHRRASGRGREQGPVRGDKRKRS